MTNPSGVNFVRRRSYYARLFDSYWTGTTGRAIQAAGGPSATLLGLYLFSNRFCNAIGLYRVCRSTILGETPITPADLAPAAAVLAAQDFAHWDGLTGDTFVVTFAARRLALDTGPIAPARLAGIRRLCAKAVDNLFYPQFFHTYVDQLDLHQLGVPIPSHHGLRSAGHKTYVRTNERISAAPRRASIPPTDRSWARFPIYILIAEEAIRDAAGAGHGSSPGAIDEACRRLCAARHVAYDPDAMRRVIRVAWGARRRA